MGKIRKLEFVHLAQVTFDISLVLCLLFIPSAEVRANEEEALEDTQRPPDVITSKGFEPEKLSYQNLLPQTEVREFRPKLSEERHGFDDEDRSFSDDLKNRDFASMTGLAKAFLEYIDVPNSVLALLTTAKLSVRMQRDSQGWRPVRIDGDSYLRAIFAESWLYLSKQSEFRRVLEKIEYSSVRFEVNLRVSSSLAVDEKPQSRIQGNSIAIDLQLKRSTAKEWKLLAAWQDNGGVALGIDVIGLAVYAYEAYKNRNKEDPILLWLQRSPAYKAPLRSPPIVPADIGTK